MVTHTSIKRGNISTIEKKDVDALYVFADNKNAIEPRKYEPESP